LILSQPSLAAGRESAPGENDARRGEWLNAPGYWHEHTNKAEGVPMSEYEQSKKFADKSAKITNETLAKGKAVAEQSAEAVQQSYSVAVENVRALNVKMIDMARANADATFDLAFQIATAKTPSDIVELWPEYTRKQFEMLSEQTKELTALGQKIAGESAAPIARSVNQVFKTAS